MLYQISNGAVAYADHVVIEEINFEVRNTEKIAIVGRNGCGKTTLLKLIMGEVDMLRRDGDEASISITGQVEIGYLKQMTFEDDSICLSDEIRKVFQPILDMKSRMEQLLLEIEQSADEKAVEEYSALEARFTYLGG